jgi:RimK family alpha-L-glutamate ligase
VRFAVVAHRPTPTNLALVRAGWPRATSSLLRPAQALALLGPGDVALGRLDVRPTLDGVERGLRLFGRLVDRGVHVLNLPSALLAAHDKLLTARALKLAQVPHPATAYAAPGQPLDAELDLPLVVKPRFGSWGAGIELCRDEAELRAALDRLGREPWFERQGALVQELVGPAGYDLRLIVAGDEVVGAIRRVAAPGEWRTNVALGATRRRFAPDAHAKHLALAAAAAVGGDFVGVDLLPTAGMDYVVLEVNGAVDFTREYSFAGNVYRRATEALAAGVEAAEAVLAPSWDARSPDRHLMFTDLRPTARARARRIGRDAPSLSGLPPARARPRRRLRRWPRRR